jgi:hypothetical protein
MYFLGGEEIENKNKNLKWRFFLVKIQGIERNYALRNWTVLLFMDLLRKWGYGSC